MMVNTLFKEYATSTAFTLSLTKNQCRLLGVIATNERFIYLGCSGCTLEDMIFSGRSLFIPTVHQLQRRGLIKRLEKGDDETENTKFYELTPAGDHILELLYLAEVIERPKTLSEDDKTFLARMREDHAIT